MCCYRESVENIMHAKIYNIVSRYNRLASTYCASGRYVEALELLRCARRVCMVDRSRFSAHTAVCFARPQKSRLYHCATYTVDHVGGQDENWHYNTEQFGRPVSPVRLRLPRPESDQLVV